MRPMPTTAHAAAPLFHFARHALTISVFAHAAAHANE